MTTYLTTSEMTHSSRFKSLARMRPDLAAAVLGGAPFSENEDEPIAVRQPLDAGMSEALVLRTMASGSGRDDDPPDDDEHDDAGAALCRAVDRRIDGHAERASVRSTFDAYEAAPERRLPERAPASDDASGDIVNYLNERTRY